MFTHIPHPPGTQTFARYLGSLLVTTLGATVGGSSAGVAGSPDRVPVTPDAAERRYASCIDGAPRTADAHEAWSLRCQQRVASGRF